MNEFIDYAYGWLDKVLSVTENGQQIASFNYHNDGQIAQAIHNGKSEDFLWDGLALIHRGETSFINEPYITGGNPVLAGDEVLFNDMLGSTLAVNGKAVEMTSFGETANRNAFFTGKPMIDELGYSFLFRDYNPNQGKWTTIDPLGYPDGWNNLAYCNNEAISSIDICGTCMLHPESNIIIPCSDSNPYASANITVSYQSVDTYKAECGTAIESSKTFSFTVSVTIAEIFGISTTFSKDVAISTSLTGAPHDGTGGGFITVGAVYTFTYYEVGEQYDCGRKVNVDYVIVNKNTTAKVINQKSCVHE